MKELSLSALVSKYPVEDIEKNIVYGFIANNNIDYTQSAYISSYLNGFIPNSKLLQYLSNLNHNKIEEIVVDMELLMPAEDKKTNGAFFTPQYIVDYIIEQIAPNQDAKVADLSCGSGAFLLGIIRYYIKHYKKSIAKIVSENIYGADILEYNTRRSTLLICLYALVNNEILDEKSINVITTDSLKHKWDFKFDAIVGNPPYVKFQDLDEATRKYLFDTYSTTKLGTYNLYFAFFELGLKVLKEEGKLGYITPNNYFTSLSGEPLRSFFQINKSIYQIVDFDATKVFDVQTYTAITFLNKKENEFISYDRIDRNESPKDFLAQIVLTKNSYSDLSEKKWRLLCGKERENIKAIENSGQTIGELFNICVGIATLKDEVYAFEPYKEDEQFYYFNKKGIEYQIEKNVTKPLVKISDMKNPDDLVKNKKRIIFPYETVKGKTAPIIEANFSKRFPKCYEYFLSVKDILDGRGKGKHIYSPFYAYGRTQGLNRAGIRIYTPTFSLKPRFMIDKEESAFFTNGYGMYFCESMDLFANPISKIENADVLLKIINSSIMDYYVTKTSVAIEGGYPCYQKNFIERFTIPQLNDSQISKIRKMTVEDDINHYLCELYHLNF